MTEHPLTDEICEQIRDSIPKLPCDEHGHTFSHDGQRILDGMVEELCEVSDAEMRSAADWQLKQVKLTGQCVINELHENNYHIEADHAAAFLEVLIEAMRPTQEDN